MNESFRGFIAVELPDQSRVVIEKTQNALKNMPGYLNWVKPSSIHLTLKFLGQTPKSSIESITKTLNNVVQGTTPFNLFLEGVGVFPNLRRPRVVWIGLKGDIDMLKNLQKQVESAMQQLGFEPENREFKPHLTLARIKSGKGDHHWERIIQKTVVENSPPIRVSSFYLFQSILKPTGAQYNKLACFSF
ncbi:MAG: 2'-5' RNA ligase [Candidatus Schekmanbacteria bacterium RBG_13_48_7]|uniref:RNA 2',3'-cyclic phosphodiesterase n=1 Tax=Candidatus Schekmanbacteria bacterium RBG_13_48_7 TaxID=1817878 RepID=A0A1F7S0W1_9BACT|nr:MAG: 2'-5' RNA ligase [Candidatus Schekmanbacteria bacterium RBG_13_48_7]